MKRLAALAVPLMLLRLPAPAAESLPAVKQLGKTVVGYRDDRLRIVVSYRYANQVFATEPWIFLEAGVTGSGGKPVEIDREDVALLAPDGTRIPMPSQKAMAEGIPDVRWMMQKAQVSRDPITGYFPSALRAQRIGFFAIPGTEITFSRFSVDSFMLALGDLFFDARGGKFAPGTYALLIKNKEVDVKIPFTLPAGKVEKPVESEKPKDGTIPW